MSEIIPPRPIPPPWVSNVVEDRFGLSVILRVGNAQQLFRWIRPGHFLMGTQADESERGSAELQHEVTLSNGYWLADTACTQAFWLAVWPVNPSHFQDHPQNPVENVSWHDAQGFIAELNRRFPGLYARLPSEAEWEYACRAWYGEYPAAPQFDPSGPIIGKMRVLRGGTWSDPARYARSANRSRIEPAYRPRSSGFRVALGQIRSPVGIHNRIC